MVKVPAANLFPGTGPHGNGMSQLMTDRGMWFRNMKTDGCVGCHQLGDKATRTIPAALGHFNTGAEAWERRLQSGQASGAMMGAIGRFDTQRALAAFGDWTDRVAKGELPKSDAAASGRRASAISSSRNGTGTRRPPICMTRSRPTATIRRSTRMACIYGSTEASSDFIPWLDPVDNKSGLLKTEYRDPKTPTSKTDPILRATRPIGATKRSGTATPPSTTRCMTARAGCG